MLKLIELVLLGWGFVGLASIIFLDRTDWGSKITDDYIPYVLIISGPIVWFGCLYIVCVLDPSKIFLDKLRWYRQRNYVSNR